VSEVIFRTPHSGRPIQTKNRGQSRIVEAATHNSVVFADGPAGTGKTFVSLALSMKALSENKTDEVVLTRPAVEAGDGMGYLPGDLTEKLDPYITPFYQILKELIGQVALNNYREAGKIRFEPLSFLRGQTLDRCYVVLDEAQNATPSQLKMLLTRLGKRADMFVTGDPEQTDLSQTSALRDAEMRLRGLDDIQFVDLTVDHIVRHSLVKQVIKAYRGGSSSGSENASSSGSDSSTSSTSTDPSMTQHAREYNSI
jgi:phosphate starvation-inducible PhoH-like protein